MKKIFMFNFVIALFALLSLAACNNYSSGLINNDLDLITEKQFFIDPGNDLRIKVSGGDVSITSWNRPEVQIKVLGNENAREKLDYIFDNSDSYVELKTESKGAFFNWFSNISLNIEVKVPRKFNTEIHTSGGDIALEEVEGTSEIHTSGGDVECRDFLGSLDVSTSGGDVRLRGGNTLVLAHTSGGDISLDYSGENMGIDLSTSGGDIRIKIPNDLNADMELSTSGGDLSCNLSMNRVSKFSDHKIVAELNGGGYDLLAHTSGGDITVRKKD